jgi:outer membrane cobalamin receptor
MGNESSWRRWSHIVAELAYKDFYLTYTRGEQDFLGEDGLKFITPQTQQNIFVNRLAYRMETLRAHYEHWVGKEMKLKPSIEMSRGIPMATQNLTVAGINTNTWSNMSIDLRRYQAELEWNYNPTDKDEISCGIGGQINTFYGVSTFGNPGIQTSTNTADTTNFMRRGTVYGYVQYTRQREKIGFTTGIRTEQTPFGNATVPRIGITYVQKKMNAKLLYGRAFRTPMLYQAFSRSYSAGELVPETTHTFDLELGYKFDKYTYLRGNAFHTQIDKPITYLGAEEAYRNYGSVRTVGAEVEIKYQVTNAQFFVNLAYAVPIKKFTNIDFMNQASNRFLALPTLKMNMGGSFTYQKMTIGSTATWIGTRHAQTQNSALNSTLTSTVIETQTYPSMLLVNLNLLFVHVFHKHLSFRLACQNLFNAPYTVLQPYYGGHAPLPVGDRQLETVVMLKF